jgi:hypothetical protein
MHANLCVLKMTQMKKIIFTFNVFLFLFIVQLKAQNIFPSNGSAGVGTTIPNTSALLEMVSTTKGLLISRMTKTQRDAIASPSAGLMIYQTNNTPGFYYFDGSAWLPISIKGVNKTLSNLTGPTAANVELLPNANNTLNLGSSSLTWKNIYAGSSYYIGGSKVIDNAGVNNTFLGATYNTANSGNGNTFTGADAGTFNTTGSLNTSTGAFSMYANTTGDVNSAYGFAALESNTSGHHNTAIGAYALVSDTSGYSNTASGTFSLSANTTGFNNTATGASSLDSNTIGVNNTAIGALSLYSNKTGNTNTATGANSLYLNNGTGNTASGSSTLYYNKTGNYNAAFGQQSLFYNNTGNYNTAMGAFALDNNTGHFNAALGSSAMSGNSTGSFNTGVGSYTSVNGSNYSNSTMLGYDAEATASNQVRIGNNAVTSIGGFTNWTNISDGRVKKNIKQNVPGLAFINKLQPVTYNLDLDAVEKIVQKPAIKNGDGKIVQASTEEIAAKNEKEKVLYTGFVAQDVEQAAKSLGFDFSGVDAAKNDKDLYGLRYSEFVVPLVKAVQELSKQNEEQQKQIDTLISLLTQKTSTVANSSAISFAQTKVIDPGSSMKLAQNAPNPFSASTTIAYFLPVNNGNVYINFYNNNGALLKSVKLNGTGSGSITLNARELSSGIYRYSLTADDKVIDSKQMERLK